MADQGPGDVFKDKGNKCLQAGDFDGAIDAYSEGINLDEQNYVLYSNRSMAYMKKEMYSEALADATKTVFLAPNWAKGAALFALGRAADAKYAYQKGISLAPLDQQLRAGLAQVMEQEQGNFLKEQQEKLEQQKKEEEERLKKEEEQRALEETMRALPVSQLKALLGAHNIDYKNNLKPEETKEAPESSPQAPPKSSNPFRGAATFSPPDARPTSTTTTPGYPSVSPSSPSPSVNTPPTPAYPSPPTAHSTSTPQSPSGGESSRDREKKEKEEDDVDYYEILGIDKKATTAEIKKAYYRKAKDCHPDKTDDPKAEEQFKLISEAYTILMDEEKRKLYDKFGRKAVQSGGPDMDPTMVFRMIFGGGTFDDTFGELGMITMMTMDESATAGKTEAEIMAELSEKMEKTREELKGYLLEKLDKKLSTKSWDFIVEGLQDKIDAPGGPALLDCVGYVYVSEAKKSMGRFLGVEGFVAGMEEKGHNVKQTVSVVSSMVKMAQVQAELEKKGEMGAEIDAETQAQMMNHGLDALWKMGKMEIEKTCRTVCQSALNSDKKLRKKRAAVLKELGELYRRESKKVRKETGTTGTFKDFVQPSEAQQDKV